MNSSDVLTRGDKVRLTRLRPHILHWYASHGRALPWRDPSASTFEKICVEVLLQRTRAETVAAIYPDFFNRFASWQSIASTNIQELEEAFKPIGLWQRRARSIKALASYAAKRDGQFPRNEAELARVPAVGQYVTNAILLFQHGKPRPLIDVNMARVIERYLRPRRLADIRHDPWLQAASCWLVRGPDPVSINWAVLDLANTHCKPRTPICNGCPVKIWCNTGKVARES